MWAQDLGSSATKINDIHNTLRALNFESAEMNLVIKTFSDFFSNPEMVTIADLEAGMKSSSTFVAMKKMMIGGHCLKC